MAEVKEGYIIDFISGQQLKATPEEVEAVQVFARILVEDYGYPKEYIQTRPQFHVKVRPSDVKKEYPTLLSLPTRKGRMTQSLLLLSARRKTVKTDVAS